MDELRLTAYHEAGHAIASREMEIAIISITIVPDGAVAGSVHCNTACRCPFNTAVILSAGLAATNRLNGITSDINGIIIDAIAAKSEIDLIEAYWAVSEYNLTEDETERAAWVAYKQATELVKTHWQAVEAIAGALLRQGTLTGAEVAALLNEAE